MPKLANFPASTSPSVRALVATGDLPAFPSVSQLDGSPNADDNCFIVAPVDCLNWLTGSAFTGAEVLIDIYGPGYSGGGDSWAPPALAWYEAHGCQLDAAQWADDNNVGDVLAYVRAGIDAGHPSVMTWPSQWGIETRDTAGGYHAVVCYGYEPDGSCWFANPWGGLWQQYPGDWVASRCVNAGTMRKAGSVSVTDQGLGAGFKALADARGITAAQVSPGEVKTNNPSYPGEAFALWADGTIFYYTDPTQGGMGVRADRGAYLVWEFWTELQAARAQLAKLQAAQPAPPDPTMVARAAAYELVAPIVAQAAAVFAKQP